MIIIATATASCVTRVTASKAPAVPTTREWLGLNFIAVTLA
jgi:hypothetical protein